MLRRETGEMEMDEETLFFLQLSLDPHGPTAGARWLFWVSHTPLWSEQFCQIPCPYVEAFTSSLELGLQTGP